MDSVEDNLKYVFFKKIKKTKQKKNSIFILSVLSQQVKFFGFSNCMKFEQNEIWICIAYVNANILGNWCHQELSRHNFNFVIYAFLKLNNNARGSGTKAKYF